MEKQHGRDHWSDEALCKGMTELFFAHRGDWKSSQSAREICEKCPVAWECLNLAIENDERYGIYGGLSYTDRRKMVLKRKLRGPIICGTRSSYIRGCRCADCTETQRVYNAEWRRNAASGFDY